VTCFDLNETLNDLGFVLPKVYDERRKFWNFFFVVRETKPKNEGDNEWVRRVSGIDFRNCPKTAATRRCEQPYSQMRVNWQSTWSKAISSQLRAIYSQLRVLLVQTFALCLNSVFGWCNACT
jgi:hypothetical protein